MNRDYIKFVISSLRRRKLRSWLTMLGIFIGIASVVSLIGLGEGLREAINSQFGALGTDFLRITATGGMGPPGTGVVNPLSDKELNEIEKIPGIKEVAGRIIESGKLVFNRNAGFEYAASMPDGKAREVMEDVLNMEIEKGRMLKDGDKGVVVLGSSFAEEDTMFGKPILPGSKIKLQDIEFKVIGILEKSGNMMLDGMVFMNEDEMRDMFDREKDEYDLIVARFDQSADVDKITADVEKKIRRVRGVKEGEEDFSVETPASIIESVNSTLLGIQIFVYIIAGISLLVGGIGIMNTMYTAVVERTKEIGIMKSIGATNSTIFSLFFIESGFLGIVGGIIGATLGFLAAHGLAFIGRLALGADIISAYITPQLIIGALLFSFILGSFFGTFPAIQASKLNPVEAIRSTK